MHEAASMLLKLVLRQVIDEPNVESGFARIHALTASKLDDASLAQAVETCLSEGLVREPVRLPDSALQCRWCLELTPRGLALARAQLDRME
jgi:hypothetical protein